MSALLGTFLPGLVAYNDGVYDSASMTNEVLSAHLDAKNAISVWKQSHALLENRVAALDASIAAKGPTNSDLALRHMYIASLKKPPPISIQPFYLHLLMFFWPTIYFGLGAVAFVVNPSIGRRATWCTRWKTTLLISISLFALQIAPVVLRNISATTMQTGRTVYAYSNLDVDRRSFAIQLFNFYLFSILLSIVWVNWSAWTVECRRRLHQPRGRAPLARLALLSATLRQWQVSFALISLGFFIYTGIFWEQIIVHHDMRLTMEAITAHALWLTTGIILFCPFATCWRSWQQYKRQSIATLIFKDDQNPEKIRATLEAFEALDPVGFWNATASTIVTFISFAAPLAQALLRRALP